MGEVYLAEDTVLERKVAIKLIAKVQPSTLVRERFLREARAIARLQHRHVVAVYRASTVGEVPYIVSELISGGSLDALKAPIPSADLIRVGLGLASGLAAAHRRGVLHRDLKPANVLLGEDGEVKLCDFGLAKIVDDISPAAQDDRGHDPGPVELTHAGAVMGTPRYIAPEIWGGEPASIRSDLYALGATLYKLASGHPAVMGDGIDAIRAATLAGRPALLSSVAPGVDVRIAAVIDRCLEADPNRRPGSAEDVHAALMLLSVPATAVPAGNPYRGLRAFDAQHRALFFGRQSESTGVLERLRADSFVAVVGDSGTGKSSLCLAGVLPLATDDRSYDGRTWSTACLTPGREPLAQLARALKGISPDMDEDACLIALREDPVAAARSVRTRLGRDRGLLLFVDQLEELVTESPTDQREAFAVALATLAGRLPGVHVLATLRGDFLTRLAELPELGRELTRATFLLRHLEPSQLREAIVAPLQASGLTFESDELVETLARDAGRGGLPLLQFALAELWERRDVERGVISASSLDRIGGVSGALAWHADGVLAGLSDSQRAIARRLLVQLVTVDGTRAYRETAELVGDDPSAQTVLTALVRGRLLTVLNDLGRNTVSVAHEALVTGWGTLRGWLDRDSDRRLVHERLAAAALEWERLGHSPVALWSPLQLAEAARVELSSPLLAGRERGFLEASRKRARTRVWQRRAMVVAAPLLIAALWAGIALESRMQRSASVREQLSLARPDLSLATATSGESLTLRAAAFALFDVGLDDRGEAVWVDAEKAYETAQGLFQRVTGPLETALQLDRERTDVRDGIASTLYTRAILAEAFHDKTRLDEMLTRLRWADRNGIWMARWFAPADLDLSTSPAGARVSVVQFDQSTTPWSMGKPRVIGASPVHERLAPGSYLFLLEAPGRPMVRYPVLLTRGASVQLRVALPAMVPAGYAYVAAGKFLYGSGDGDGLRHTLLASPEHARTTPSYLIGKHEVTWAEWMEFLRSLPREEAKKLEPRTDGVEFSLDRQRYHLALRPNTRVYEADEGTPFVYASRDSGAVQDWRRTPVTGIDVKDANAYAAWLSETHRLPGARLCSEIEWERAGKGADSRIFPSGNSLLPADANFDETYGRTTDAFGPDEVGTHPQSDSPFAVSDLAGNAWEIVTAAGSPNVYFEVGGGFYHSAMMASLSNRGPAEVGLRSRDIGLRICSSSVF